MCFCTIRFCTDEAVLRPGESQEGDGRKKFTRELAINGAYQSMGPTEGSTFSLRKAAKESRWTCTQSIAEHESPGGLLQKTIQFNGHLVTGSCDQDHEPHGF